MNRLTEGCLERTVGLMENQEWRLNARCNSLTPEQADKLFFPSSGGKPTKAEIFCGRCPVRSICLREAIEKELEGFMCGTTENQRKVMAKEFHIKVNPLMNQYHAALPQRAKEKVKPVYRKWSPPQPDTLEYLNSLNPPEVLT